MIDFGLLFFSSKCHKNKLRVEKNRKLL